MKSKKQTPTMVWGWWVCVPTAGFLYTGFVPAVRDSFAWCV